MNFNLIGLFFTLINIILFIAIVMIIVTGIKKLKSFISEMKGMSKKVDHILNKLEK